MRARGAWLLIPLAWAVSCGGRYLEPGEASYDVAGNTSSLGGSGSAQAGKNSGGGSGKATAGKSGTGASGGSGNAGSGNAGGGGVCACDPIACAPGYRSVPTPNSCCYHCELDPTPCLLAREDYARFRRELIDKYSSAGCQAASDCSVYYEMNACANSCGIALPTLRLTDFDANLTTYAKRHCAATCPLEPAPLCEPREQPLCLEGACL